MRSPVLRACSVASFSAATRLKRHGSTLTRAVTLVFGMDVTGVVVALDRNYSVYSVNFASIHEIYGYSADELVQQGMGRLRTAPVHIVLQSGQVLPALVCTTGLCLVVVGFLPQNKGRPSGGPVLMRSRL